MLLKQKHFVIVDFLSFFGGLLGEVLYSFTDVAGSEFSFFQDCTLDSLHYLWSKSFTIFCFQCRGETKVIGASVQKGAIMNKAEIS